MATNYRMLEHWVSGDEYTQNRRDLWLLEPDGLWMQRWATEYRRGGPGNPITRNTYDDEEAARWAIAAKMEQCRNEAAGADWTRV